MHEILLRDYRDGDIDDVARIWRDGWMSSGLATGGDPTLDEFRQRIATEGGRDWHIRLACRGGEVVGFVAVSVAHQWLRQIFVKPDAQGMGVGTMLLDDVKREFAAGFWLRTDIGNGAARRFYEKHGLALEGEAPHPISGRMAATYRWRARA